MELSWLITGILVAVLIYFIHRLLAIQNDCWKKIGLPCAESPSLIVTLWKLILMKKGLGEIIVDLYKKYDGHKFIGYYQFLSPAIMIRDPELINQILIKDFTHFEDRGPPLNGVKDLITSGLGKLTGDEWRTVRHKITPTFTTGKLKMMFGLIKEYSEQVVRHIDSKPGEHFEARDLMLRYILNVIGDVAIGIKLDMLNMQDKKSQEFYKYSSSYFKPSVFLFLKLMITMSKPKIREILKFRIMGKDTETFFSRLTNDVIKHREHNKTGRNDFFQLMLDLHKNGLNDESDSETSTRERKFIDTEDKEFNQLLKDKPLGSTRISTSEIFTEELISCQTFLFISEGSETTSNVLSFVLYELAVNQDLQKKVQDEINNVIDCQGFNYQAIRKLTYMEQFMNETLCVHPLATMVRICTRDYKIPGTEYIIPKGSIINIPVGGLHKDPLYFPDPDKFNPDRFENMDAITKGAFFSFGAGRNLRCSGLNFVNTLISFGSKVI